MSATRSAPASTSEGATCDHARSWTGRANEPLLEVDDLRTYFDTPRGVVKAVDGVSLRVDRGKTLGIVGESGSGKTVLSRSIMNLLPKNNTIREGSVRFEGRELTTMKNKEMRTIWGAEMAMILQDPMTSLNPVTKIGEQITESLGIHLGEKGKVAKAHAVELLKSVGIPAAERRLGEYPHQLSGGMRQRVTIAIALACGPKLLVADEPTTALDVTVQRQILDLLESQQHAAQHGPDHHHPRPRRRRRSSRRDRGHVRGTDRRAGAHPGAVRPQPAPLHRGSAAVDPAAAPAQPHQTAGHPGPAAGPGGPAPGCPFAPRCNYAQDKCLTETPLLAPHAAGHEAACHFPVGTTAGQDALARNLAAGRTAAGTPLDSTVIATAGVSLMAGSGTAHLRDQDDIVLRVEGLVVEFPLERGQKVHAVSGISFDIAKGETLGLVGESGCGKSTTGRAIMQAPRPTSGEVLFDGKDLSSLSRRRAPAQPHQAADDLPGPDLVAEPAAPGEGHRGRGPVHLGGQGRRRSRGSTRCWRRSGSTPNGPAGGVRTRCPVVSASASRSPGR